MLDLPYLHLQKNQEARMTRYYEIQSRDIGGLYFRANEAFYFQDHFVCIPMIKSWQVPPISVIRRRQRAADFSSWSLSAPVVTERICDILSDLRVDCVEFLPFYITERDQKLFAINVLTTDPSKLLFKRHPKGLVYVQSKFCGIAVKHQFTGLDLADPDANNLYKIVRGENINACPGL
jgi:hypothetical protein